MDTQKPPTPQRSTINENRPCAVLLCWSGHLHVLEHDFVGRVACECVLLAAAALATTTTTTSLGLGLALGLARRTATATAAPGLGLRTNLRLGSI